MEKLFEILVQIQPIIMNFAIAIFLPAVGSLVVKSVLKKLGRSSAIAVVLMDQNGRFIISAFKKDEGTDLRSFWVSELRNICKQFGLTNAIDGWTVKTELFVQLTRVRKFFAKICAITHNIVVVKASFAFPEGVGQAAGEKLAYKAFKEGTPGELNVEKKLVSREEFLSQQYDEPKNDDSTPDAPKKEINETEEPKIEEKPEEKDTSSKCTAPAPTPLDKKKNVLFERVEMLRHKALNKTCRRKGINRNFWKGLKKQLVKLGNEADLMVFQRDLSRVVCQIS